MRVVISVHTADGAISVSAYKQQIARSVRYERQYDQ